MVTSSEGEYATAADLATFTHDQLESHQRPSPGVSTLTALFRAMYAASMATEEGQEITFELTWINPDNPDPDPPQRIVADRWSSFPFTSRIPLTTRALVKAAKATDPRTSSFAVYTSAEEPLFVWGLVDQGNRPYEFMRYDYDEGQDRPGLFQASAIGVGHLKVSIGYEPIAELRIDHLSTGGLDPFKTGPIFEALKPGLKDHVRRVKAAISTEVYKDRSHWDATLGSQWIETLSRVLLRIQDMRHGGAVLITPDTSGNGLDVKYELSYHRLPVALKRSGITKIEETHASDLISEALDADEDLIDTAHYLDETIARAERENIESEIDGILWFIACLSRVDGLVLMDSDLSVEGFGTVIAVEDTPKAVLAAQDDQGDPSRLLPLSYDTFGTRHRSMMRYCNSYPASIGFVISQDGDVRAMTKVGDNLVVWDNVRLHRFLPERDDDDPEVS